MPPRAWRRMRPLLSGPFQWLDDRVAPELIAARGCRPKLLPSALPLPAAATINRHCARASPRGLASHGQAPLACVCCWRFMFFLLEKRLSVRQTELPPFPVAPPRVRARRFALGCYRLPLIQDGGPVPQTGLINCVSLTSMGWISLCSGGSFGRRC